MQTDNKGLPPIHLRDGQPTVNSRDLFDFFEREVKSGNQALRRLIDADRIHQPDVLITRAQAKSRFDSFDLKRPAVLALMDSFCRHGDDLKRSAIAGLFDRAHMVPPASPPAEARDGERLLADFAAALGTRPLPIPLVKAHTKPDEIVVRVEVVDGHRVINSHTLCRLLGEKHRAVRNVITKLAAHDIYFSRRVDRAKSRGEVVGNTFSLDREAAIRVLNEFGPVKRERIMAPLIAAFDAVDPTALAAPILDLAPVVESAPLPAAAIAEVAPAQPEPVLDEPAMSTPDAVKTDADPIADTAVDVVPTLDQPIVFDRRGTLLTTSRDVAAYFGKAHNHVLRDIDAIFGQAKGSPVEEIVKDCFVETVERHPRIANQTVRYFEMDERGLMVAVGRFTGTRALIKQMSYAQEFKRMRTLIDGPQPIVQASIEDIVRDPKSFVRLFQAYAAGVPDAPSAIASPVSKSPRAPRADRDRPRNKRNRIGDDGTMSLMISSHILNYRARLFNERLRAAGYLDAQNVATDDAVRRGLFVVRSGKGYNGSNFKQSKMTGAGLDWFEAHPEIFAGLVKRAV